MGVPGCRSGQGKAVKAVRHDVRLEVEGRDVLSVQVGWTGGVSARRTAGIGALTMRRSNPPGTGTRPPGGARSVMFMHGWQSELASIDDAASGSSASDFWNRVRVYRGARRAADHARADWDLLGARASSGTGPGMLLGAAVVLSRLQTAEQAEGETGATRS